MTPLPTATCPAFTGGSPPFKSLRAIDRVGASFYENPQNRERILAMQEYRSFRMCCLRTTLAIVDACQVPERAAVSVRLKRLNSIRRKIGRKETHFTLGRLDDVIGVRVICQSLSSGREFSRRICASPYSYRIASPYSYRIKDYIEAPRATGYRGINHIMRFAQPVTEVVKVHMRFEVQVRTVLQHKWAVWSESHGEAVKLGVGAEEEQERLRRCSWEVAQWEDDNPGSVPFELPLYTGGRSITVPWRIPHGVPILYGFHEDIQSAIGWLNYLERTNPSKTGDALLLVGVATGVSALRLVRLTHPLFTGNPAHEPKYWMPESPEFRAGT